VHKFVGKARRVLDGCKIILTEVGSPTRVSLGKVSLLNRSTDNHGGGSGEDGEDSLECNHFEDFVFCSLRKKK